MGRSQMFMGNAGLRGCVLLVTFILFILIIMLLAFSADIEIAGMWNDTKEDDEFAGVCQKVSDGRCWAYSSEASANSWVIFSGSNKCYMKVRGKTSCKNEDTYKYPCVADGGRNCAREFKGCYAHYLQACKKEGGEPVKIVDDAENDRVLKTCDALSPGQTDDESWGCFIGLFQQDIKSDKKDDWLWLSDMSKASYKKWAEVEGMWEEPNNENEKEGVVVMWTSKGSGHIEDILNVFLFIFKMVALGCFIAVAACACTGSITSVVGIKQFDDGNPQSKCCLGTSICCDVTGLVFAMIIGFSSLARAGENADNIPGAIMYILLFLLLLPSSIIGCVICCKRPAQQAGAVQGQVVVGSVVGQPVAQPTF